MLQLRMAMQEARPKTVKQKKISDLIGNYLNDFKATPYPRVDKFDIVKGIDHVTNNLVECIELT